MQLWNDIKLVLLCRVLGVKVLSFRFITKTKSRVLLDWMLTLNANHDVFGLFTYWTVTGCTFKVVVNFRETAEWADGAVLNLWSVDDLCWSMNQVIMLYCRNWLTVLRMFWLLETRRFYKAYVPSLLVHLNKRRMLLPCTVQSCFVELSSFLLDFYQLNWTWNSFHFLHLVLKPFLA